MKPLNSIIVDPQLVNREMVRAAAKAVPELGDTVIVSRLTEAMNEIQSSRFSRDLIFISHRVPEDTVAPFFARLNMYRDGDEVALIRVKKGSLDASGEVASGLAKGFHGVLCEPFSILGLKDCVEIAVQVKTLSRAQRLRYAVSLVYPTYLRRLKKNPNIRLNDLSGPEIEDLQNTCTMLREMVDYSGIAYDRLIQDLFDKIEKNSLRAYEGASQRLTERYHLEKATLGSIREHVLQLGN
jgi:hypothetical protein